MPKLHTSKSAMTFVLVLLGLCLLSLSPWAMPAEAEDGKDKRRNEIRLAPVEPPRPVTKPQVEVRSKSPDKPTVQKRNPDPIDLKVLIISADGNETDFPAIKAFLSQIGIPFDTLIATQQRLVSSMLWDGGVHAYYQAVILSTGNLTYFNTTSGQWQSAFDDAEWTALWQFEATFGIRQVTSYTYPAGYPDNYGLNLVTYQDTSVTPLQAQLTSAGKQVFPYLNTNSPITVQNAWVYLATVSSPTVTTPLLTTSEGYAIASITQYPDGRQNLAVTAANNPDLLHSMLLSYGVVNWATKGLFLGERHVNMDYQPDDLLIDDDIWDTKALTDTTGLSYRMTEPDLNATLAYQNSVRAQLNSKNFKLEFPFNCAGATGIYTPDSLTPAVKANQGSFNWISHTYTHLNLDVPTTYAQTLDELNRNRNCGLKTLGLSTSNFKKDAMVQPAISGLFNIEAWRAMKDFGILYVIDNTSQKSTICAGTWPNWNNPSPNAGFYNGILPSPNACIYPAGSTPPSILIIPRHPTNLFYNLSTPDEWVSEYNCYYGPNGPCAGGAFRYWPRDLTYTEILDKESEWLLRYLLKWDIDPLMFHQTNLRAYDGTHSLLSDLIDATLKKYIQVYNLPIRNQSQHDVGIIMARRMANNGANVRASLIPCTSITLTADKSALAPVTGVSSGSNREVYGGQNISYVQINANQSLTLPAPPC